MSAQVHFVSTGPVTYADLEAVPADYTAELVNGRLHALPRPKGRHIHSASVLGRRLGSPFEDGDGGPGGWWILDEPEVHFVLDVEVTVPDLAGWRRERLPEMPDGHKFTVVPDWICEILSPRTREYDLDEKLPLYARHGVPFLWLIDPDVPWLEAHVLDASGYRESARFGPTDLIQAPPFEAVAFSLFSAV
jgi:Uma2 family endonuclease